MTSNVSIWDDKIHVIYVVELVFYSGLLCGAVAALLRRRESLKGFFLSIISALKIAGLAISLNSAVKTVNATNDNGATEMPSTGLVIAGSILISLATTPLLFLTQSFAFPKITNRLVSRLVRLAVIAPAALSIAGYNLLSEGNSNSSSGISLVKASSILYLVIYVNMVSYGLVTFCKRNGEADQLRTLSMYTVLLAMPFFLVRFVYTIVASFDLTSDISAFHKFDIFNGDWRIYLAMFVVMEFIVELVYVIGLHLLINREVFASQFENQTSSDGTKSNPDNNY
ncbi:LANO_0A04610g1_1 [Lachancea nothofagi CBS 11611]|uniref:LANO_0A04610g1_1 n=1 Tax=Lachancea nothofagi CBS 11611 TaxID=1266666 RepID=A0A1G4IR13_9SACH|nr:LANO_0A04610g1_1 [Lachancea nothofagi CBS 11611]